MSAADPKDSSRPVPPSEPAPAGLRGLDPGELLARGLQTAKLSGGRDAWEPPTPEELNRLLPQYNIVSLIGRGGMGAVYKGTQVILDRPVAIKLLPAEIAADEQFVIRFHREARTLAKLQHSRIITIHDFGQTAEGHLYFVMEYIDGTNLREVLRGPGLSPEQALLVTGQICDALQTAHAQGVIHRDIKPENILITKDGYVKLADFGLSRPVQEENGSALTGTNVIMGTADYMAPEQREGQADQRADIFALGVMLYEMLTGKPPRGAFEAASRKVQLDVRIDQVVLKALQSEPDRRYQRISEMKTDVDRIRNTPLPAPAPTAPPKAATPTRQRSRALFIASPIVVLLLCIAGYFIFFRGRNSPPIPTGPNIGLQTHPAGVVELRNVRIKDLANASAAGKQQMDSASPQAKALPTAARLVAQSPARGTTAENEALTKALLSHPWSWNAVPPESFPWKEIVFRSDGSVTTPTTPTGRWTITGLNSVTLQFGQADRLLLTFYSGSDYFTGCREAGKIVVSGQLKSWQKPSSATASEPDFRSSGERNPASSQPSTPAPAAPPRAISDNEALTRALLSHSWSWIAVISDSFPWKQLAFWSDGTVTTSTTVTGRWTITGVHSLAIQFSGGGGRIILNLNSSMDYYTASRDDGRLVASGRFTSLSETAPARTVPPAPAAPVAATQASLSLAADSTFTRGPEVSLFNGRDLTGWNGRQGYWSVQNGAITGKITAANLSAGNTFLVWQGGEPSDFELTCSYRLIANNPQGFANSGIQFRARYSNRERFELKGYQGEMDPGTNHPNAWTWMPNINGCLTDDTPGILLAPTGQKVIVHPGQVSNMLGKFDVVGSLGTSQPSADSYRKYDWNDYRIVAFGNHIRIFVNGLQTVDAIDEGNRFTAGLIGFQLHGLNRAKVLQFKNIVLRALHGAPVISRAGMGRPPTAVNAPAAPASSASSKTFGSYQEEAVLGHNWSWDTVVGNSSHQVIQFLEDGRVSAGWHWQWLPKPNGELVVDCFWGQDRHLYLKFDKQFTEFEAYGEQGGCQVRGKRLATNK